MVKKDGIVVDKPLIQYLQDHEMRIALDVEGQGALRFLFHQVFGRDPEAK